MEVRHVVFGAVFLAVFTIGSLNIISDGAFGHMLTSQLPSHSVGPDAEPEISLEENVSLKPGTSGSVEAEIRNAKIISYRNPTLTNRQGARIDVNADLKPSPALVQQSLPPSWVYDYVEPKIQMDISLKASEDVNPGNYTFEITAESETGSKSQDTSREFSVIVSNSSMS